MNILNLLTVEYWFYHPGADFGPLYYLLGFFGLMILTSIFLGLYWKRPATIHQAGRKLLRPLPWKIFWFAIVGLLLVFFRMENVAMLSIRFWFLFYFIVLVLWIRSAWKHYRTRYRENISMYEHSQKNKGSEWRKLD